MTVPCAAFISALLWLIGSFIQAATSTKQLWNAIRRRADRAGHLAVGRVRQGSAADRESQTRPTGNRKSTQAQEDRAERVEGKENSQTPITENERGELITAANKLSDAIDEMRKRDFRRLVFNTITWLVILAAAGFGVYATWPR